MQGTDFCQPICILLNECFVYLFLINACLISIQFHIIIRLSDLSVQSTVPHVIDVLNNLIIIALGYLTALARCVDTV
jgi:hypothetical protein